MTDNAEPFPAPLMSQQPRWKSYGRLALIRLPDALTTPVEHAAVGVDVAASYRRRPGSRANSPMPRAGVHPNKNELGEVPADVARLSICRAGGPALNLRQDPAIPAPTVIAGENGENDYLVFEGRRVGRIREATEWVGFNPGLDLGDQSAAGGPNGELVQAPTLNEAKAAFREAWERFYASLTPHDVEHWHHHQDAAAERKPVSGPAPS